MLPGPMFTLEMVTSARRVRYFVIRVLYGVVLLLCLLMVYNEVSSMRSWNGESNIAAIARMSYNFFYMFSVVQLGLVLVLGPAMAAGTVAVERERRTIEHLFVTQLSNAEIVLGKLLARLMQIAYLVLVGLPILSLAMLMGGIAPEALVMVFLITLSTMLTVSILSITVSVWSARSREAVVRAYLLIFVWLVIPPIALAFNLGVMKSSFINDLNEQFLATNPFYVLISTLSQASGVRVRDAWELLGQMARNQGIVCLIAAIGSTLAVRHVHLKNRATAVKKRIKRWQWLRPRIGNHPMLWKELFAEPAASKLGILGHILVAIIIFLVLGVTAYFFCTLGLEANRFGYDYRHREYLSFTTFMTTVLCCGILLLTAARSAYAVTSEKERDCWVSLLSTPLTPLEIVWAKVAGNLYSSRWILYVLVIIWGLAVFVEPGFIVPIVFQCVTLFILAFFVSSLGVIYSLWCKTSLKAMAATLVTGIFVGGGYLFCCMIALIGSHSPDRGIEIIFSGAMPFLLCFPSIAYQNFDNTMRNDSVLFIAFALGTIAYLFFGPVIFGAAIANFESLVGRVGRDFQPRRRALPRPAQRHPPQVSQNVIIAEAVEE